MGILNRSTLMKTHSLLAAFILPVAIMFFLTGALYTWGIKGDYDTTVHEINLNTPIKGDLSELVVIATKELEKYDIEAPTGQAKVKNFGEAFKLEWTGSKVDIIVEPTSRPLIAKLKIKKTSWHRQFVQLHKAKGGSPFKVYAVILAIALLLLLVSGFIMAWQMPKLRNLTLVSSSMGIVVFIAMVASS
jgi:hypothetical protein